MDDERAATIDERAEEGIDATKSASMFKQPVRHNRSWRGAKTLA
ncbi:hypothetical protein CI1B_29730 [Bradyrhizobium ivorense]|uniref:Uncharacterized protein n=1 Tax=Bradyrhizobium ivorense TaxID=2511166 RepID=A0A508T428_9BRAD|nr:hypothetical protein [Bradyrhizobium ivorense]VIO70142.1 hypothetical protein CI1B_29730 [Bradyrhizobium ivorense]